VKVSIDTQSVAPILIEAKKAPGSGQKPKAFLGWL
jgi:hypothetical protein